MHILVGGPEEAFSVRRSAARILHDRCAEHRLALEVRAVDSVAGPVERPSGTRPAGARFRSSCMREETMTMFVDRINRLRAIWAECVVVVEAMCEDVCRLESFQDTGDRQLVHRRLEGEHAWTLARRAHDRWHGYIEPRQPVCGAAVRRRVHHACRDGSLLGELVDGRGLLDDVMRDRRESAITIGPPSN